MKNYMTVDKLMSRLSTYEPNTLVFVNGLGGSLYFASDCKKTVIYDEDFESFVPSNSDEEDSFSAIVIE